MENFKAFLLKKLLDSDVYLIFNRYREYSTKSVTRDARKCEARRVYQLTENTPLPSQKAVLTVSSNKKQLMSIICSSIINDEEFQAQHTTRNKLVITGSDNVPTEIHKGVVIAREDIATSHKAKRQITSLPNKLSRVQRSILVLQWLLRTTEMCLSCSSFII